MSIWLVKINALDVNNNTVILRFSDIGYVDSSANYYEERMIQPALVKVSPNDGGVFSIFEIPSIGEIELINADGGLNYLVDYALDNGDFTLSLIDEANVQTDYLTGKVESMHESGNSVFLTIRSMSQVLERPHTNTKYAGTNVLPAGTEGVTTDIKGNVKPKVFGKVFNATPILVNTARLIYQFSDRVTCTINTVYDKGSALTLGTTYTQANFSTFETTIPTAGTFNCCMGFVKLGSAPVGTITGDCQDSTTLAGDVLESVLNELIPAVPLNPVSKTTLNSIGEIGLFISSETTTADILNQIVKSSGAHWFFVGSQMNVNLTKLAITSALELTDSEIISIERRGIGLGKNSIPYTSCLFKYNKIQTVQQETELAGSVTAARKALLARDYRSVYVNDSAVLNRHPLAGAIEIDSALVNESDATTVATRLLNMAKVRCDVVQVVAVVYQIPVITIGMGILITSSKLGYSAGRLMTVVSYEIDAKRKRITLGVIG